MESICKGIYPIPSHASAQCQFLITSMLQVQAEDRISLANIRSHPWVQNAPISNKQASLTSLASLIGCTSIESSDLPDGKTQDQQAFRDSLKLNFPSLADSPGGTLSLLRFIPIASPARGHANNRSAVFQHDASFLSHTIELCQGRP